MSKQEEIEKRLWEIIDSCASNPAVDTVGIILNYLHSQGVVIKVDRELPSVFDINEDVISALKYKEKLVGCGFFEPLIE